MEILIAIGAMSVLLISLLSLVTLSLKNSRLSKDRAQAVALAQEGIELMRAYRDYSWSGFRAKAGLEYNLPGNWVVGDGLTQNCNQTPSINGFFWRCVDLDAAGSNEVLVAVEVGWNEGGQTLTTKQDTRLTLWER